MSPETEANDYVPLEFLLGARVKFYLPNSATQKHPGHSSNAKKIFASSIHPRRREEQARDVLRRVLVQDAPRDIGDRLSESVTPVTKPDRAEVLKVLSVVASTSLANQEDLFDHDSFQLNFDDVKQSPDRMIAPRQNYSDKLDYEEQRLNSFHGYEQDCKSFLNVAGAAARIPQTTTRKLRDLKLGSIKSRKKLEDKRTQELVLILQDQRAHTRKALRHHKQVILEELATTSSSGTSKPPKLFPTKMLTLGSDLPNNKPTYVGGLNVVSYGDKMPEIEFPPQDQDFNFDHWQLEQSLRRPTILTTLQLDGHTLADSKKVNHDGYSLPASAEEDSQLDSDENDKKVSIRLRERQREVFASTAANGLFFGGGFIAKKTKSKYAESNPASNRRAQVENEREFLESLLGAQSAVILPLAEANKPALRRRDASAGRRHPRNQLKTHQDDK